MPKANVAQHGGTREGAGRKTKHPDGSVQLAARVSQIALNRLDAIARDHPKSSRADVLERLIDVEYRRLYGPPIRFEPGGGGKIIGVIGG